MNPDWESLIWVQIVRMIGYPNTSYEEQAGDNWRTMWEQGWRVEIHCEMQHNSNKTPCAPRKDTYQSVYYEKNVHHWLGETLCPD